MSRQPQRTCIGCRGKDDRTALIRLVRRENSLIVDRTGTMSGRGAWVHDTRDCLERAVSSRAGQRAMRARITDMSELEALAHDHP